MKGLNLSLYLRAKVFDIHQPLNKHKIDNKILVDTCILLFTYYPRLSLLQVLSRRPKKYQKKIYPNFLAKLRKSGIELYVHNLNLLEFVRLVERVELEDLYCRINNVIKIGDDFNEKNLRCYYPDEIKKIQRKITTPLRNIIDDFLLFSSQKSLDYLFGELLETWQSSLADVNDAMIVSEAKLHGINSIFSDDANLCTFKSINLYTANEKAIAAYELVKRNKEKKKKKKPKFRE